VVEATRLPRASTRNYLAQSQDAQDRIMAELHHQAAETNHKRDLHLMREDNLLYLCANAASSWT
jgi:hypothetical protein